MDKDKVLLGRRVHKPYNGEFFSFGGRLRKDESFESAAIRIIQSETGVPLNPHELVLGGVLNELNPDSRFDDVSYHSVNIYFGSIIDTEEFRLDDQHSECRWFSVSDEGLHPFVKSKLKILNARI
jgi:colanic acid biosynthesis protein WcaH